MSIRTIKNSIASAQNSDVNTISSAHAASAGWNIPGIAALNVSCSLDSSDRWKHELVSVPEWAEKIQNYDMMDAYYFGGYDVGVVAVVYRTRKRLDEGFAKIHLVDKDTREPFPQMKGVWSKTRENLAQYSYGNALPSIATHTREREREWDLEQDGKIVGKFGVPDIKSMVSAIHEMITVWCKWKDFPNVSDYNTVEKLNAAKDDVVKMHREMTNGRISDMIEKQRESIKVCQEEIAKLERELNDICEAAADGMNLLEKHGIKVDPEKLTEEADKCYDGTSIAIDDFARLYPGALSAFTDEYISATQQMCSLKEAGSDISIVSDSAYNYAGTSCAS